MAQAKRQNPALEGADFSDFDWDFSEVYESTTLDFTIADGTYDCVVADIDQEEGNGGFPVFVLTYKITQPGQYEGFTRRDWLYQSSPQAKAYTLRTIWRIYGEKPPAGLNLQKLKELICGVPVCVTFKQSEYNGKSRTEVAYVERATGPHASI